MQISSHHPWAGPIPPWATPVLWQAANDAIASAVHHHRDTLEDAMDLSQQVRSRIETLDPLMRGLCEQTCPTCTDNCCRRATVWLDFKDLLGLHMAREVVPPSQLISASYPTCLYLNSHGCTLPRTQRPFVCTWFICADQKVVLEQWPSSQKQYLWNSLAAIKNGRNKLEYLFIRAVTQ